MFLLVKRKQIKKSWEQSDHDYVCTFLFDVTLELFVSMQSN